MHCQFTLTTDEDELREGLFGQVLLYAFEILPYLSARGLKPNWAIRSKLYGTAPDYVVVPGVVDLAYDPPSPAGPAIPLSRLRQRFVHALGDDWAALGRLWSEYFRIPARVLAAADAQGSLADTLGVHYRGNDKMGTHWDSNQVSHDDMTLVIVDALKRRPDLVRVFLATDDYGFVEHLRARLDVEVVNLGRVKSHLAAPGTDDVTDRSDRALLDCVLLSRCKMVLLNSSALSAFSKVLNPSLEIYRCAASMMFTDVPYFPVAYVPVYASDDAAVQEVMARTMVNDWRTSPLAPTFLRFAARPRFRRWAMAWSLAERVDSLFGRQPPGLRPGRLGRTLAGLPEG